MDLDSTLISLKELLIYLNIIQNTYNTRIIDSEEEKEISKTCPICLDNYSDIHVSPCGHTFCWSCIQKLTNNDCPICRKKMNGVLEHPNFHFSENDHPQNINANRLYIQSIPNHFFYHGRVHTNNIRPISQNNPFIFH